MDDVNDHDPIFNQPFYRRSVPENSKRGAAILTLSADDADLNRSITYSLDGIVKISSFFLSFCKEPLITIKTRIGPIEVLELVHLNGETGEIVVSGKIDRERFAWLNLTAKASDSGMPRRSSFVPVFIQVNLVYPYVSSWEFHQFFTPSTSSLGVGRERQQSPICHCSRKLFGERELATW